MRFFLKTKYRRRVFRGLSATLAFTVLFAWVFLTQSTVLGAPNNIPNVVGQKLATAQGILRQEKFLFEAIPENTFFPGEHLKVFRQYPLAGGPPGGWNGVVKIWYYDNDLVKKSDKGEGAASSRSRTAAMVSVPMVTGLTLSQALEQLREAGLASSIAGSVFTGDRKLMLKVANQNPLPGTLVQPKSLVSLYLFRLREYKTPKEIQKELRKKDIEAK